MKIEIRTNSTDNIESLLKWPCYSIGLGDETCIHQLFPSKDLLKGLEKIAKAGRQARVVTPLISNLYIEKVANLIGDIVQLEIPIAISFNDYGLLYKCRNLVREPNKIFSLGRLLAKSVDNWPWKDRIVDNESKSVRNNLLQNNSCHDIKLAFLKQFGVSSVELNYKPAQLAYLDGYKKNEIEILVHLDWILLAVSRSCPIVRYHALTIPNCKSECQKTYLLDLVGREGVSRVDNEDEDVFAAFPQLIIWGNGIYQKNEIGIQTSILHKANQLIITDRNQSQNEWERLFNEITKE
jgi:hypothetical protein